METKLHINQGENDESLRVHGLEYKESKNDLKNDSEAASYSTLFFELKMVWIYLMRRCEVPSGFLMVIVVRHRRAISNFRKIKIKKVFIEASKVFQYWKQFSL